LRGRFCSPRERPARNKPDQDPIGQSFFAPELVIQHQEAIGLSAEQKDYFKAEIRQAQLKFTELQWNLQDEMEKTDLPAQAATRGRAAGFLRQLEKVLAAEREIKREASHIACENQEQADARAAGKTL